MFVLKAKTSHFASKSQQSSSVISFGQSIIQCIHHCSKILYGGGGGWGANEAKVDQTTEMYFLLSDPFI